MAQIFLPIVAVAVVVALVNDMRWAKRTIRAFGVANMALGLVGSYAALEAVRFFHRRPSDPPCLAEAFYVAAVINLVCLVAVFVAAIYLWRLKRAGLLISNTLFSFEILYFLFEHSIIILVLRALVANAAGVCGDAVAAVGGFGNMGTALQTITGYPLVALVGLNIAYQRLNRTEGPNQLNKGKAAR